MKNLLSKEHYCYKAHVLLMKSSAYPPFFHRQHPPYGLLPPFLWENLDPLLFYDFFKNIPISYYALPLAPGFLLTNF